MDETDSLVGKYVYANGLNGRGVFRIVAGDLSAAEDVDLCVLFVDAAEMVFGKIDHFPAAYARKDVLIADSLEAATKACSADLRHEREKLYKRIETINNDIGLLDILDAKIKRGG